MDKDTVNTSAIGTLPISGSVVTKVQNVCDTFTDQTVGGIKTFSDGITIGDDVESIGRDCLGVGNELTVGAYSFFWKGIDVDGNNSSALMYLCDEQPRYPFPFMIDGGDRTQVRILGRFAKKSVDWGDQKQVSAFATAISGCAMTSPQTKNTSELYMSSLYACDMQDPGRPDYSQLCIDFGGTSYKKSLSSVHDAMWRKGGYVDQAFTPDGAYTSSGGMAKWGLASKVRVGDEVSWVNSDKVPYTRAAKVAGVLSGGSVLALHLTKLTSNWYYWNNGTIYTTHEKDDSSVTFMDMPALSGPSVYSCRSSLAVGEANTVVRRDSFAAGRQNVTEADYCVAMGRKAKALDYCSFVWATQFGARSVEANSFTVGLKDEMEKALSISTKGPMYVCTPNGQTMPMYEYFCRKVMNDRSLLSSVVAKALSDQNVLAFVKKALA